MRPRERLTRAATPSRRRRRPILSSRAGLLLAVLLPVVVTATVVALGNPDYRLGTAFVASVALAAAFAGTRAAIVSTAISFVGFWYAAAPVSDSFAVVWPETPASLATFLVSCVAVVLIVHQRDQDARRAAASGRRYRRLADLGLIGIIFWDIDGPVTGANDAFLEMIGYSRDDLAAGRVDWRRLTPDEYEETDAERVRELVANGFHEPYEKEYLRKDGSRVPVLVGTAFLEGSEHEGISFILDLGDRWRLEQEREALLDSEREAREQAEAATRRLRVVADASDRLMQELDPEAVLRALAEAVVPELSDTASVFVPDDDVLRRAVTLHAGRSDLADVLNRHMPIEIRSDAPVARAFRHGLTIEVSNIDILGAATDVDDDDYRAAVDAMDVTDGAVVPIRVGREVLGVLSLYGTVERGPLHPDALLAAEQIAERAAAALQKAKSFAEEREIATLMQRALLPDSQRSIEGHEVGTCYLPAAVGREIGGDWWDVLALPGDLVGITVGDVSGHGVHVAPSMAKLRHSIDGVLTHGAGPAEAVDAASRLLETNRPGSYATAFVAVYDPCTRELTYSRAGHPPPLLLVDGDVVHLDHPGGTLLGLNMAALAETTITLPERFELIAFTDGLVEEPGLSYDEGVERVVRAARALPPELTGQPRAERLVADVVGTAGRDDVCVVIVRLV